MPSLSSAYTTQHKSTLPKYKFYTNIDGYQMGGGALENMSECVVYLCGHIATYVIRNDKHYAMAMAMVSGSM